MIRSGRGLRAARAPLSLAALLSTLVLFFGLQGEEIVRRSRAWYEGSASAGKA
ncbi:MAG: hypothetical protein ACLP8A_09940 [Methylovirgula sp.]